MRSTISDKQHAANKANALRSTGPRTEAGKAASSLNGLKHGLTGTMYLTRDEDKEDYARHSSGIIASMSPENELEFRLAASIADDYWRIDRIRRMEQVCLSNLFFENGPAAMKQLALLSVYESRLNRNIRNNHAEYRKLQADRRELQNEANVASDPELPGNTALHDENGFGFAFPAGEHAADAKVQPIPPDHAPNDPDSEPQPLRKAA